MDVVGVMAAYLSVVRVCTAQCIIILIVFTNYIFAHLLDRHWCTVQKMIPRFTKSKRAIIRANAHAKTYSKFKRSYVLTLKTVYCVTVDIFRWIDSGVTKTHSVLPAKTDSTQIPYLGSRSKYEYCIYQSFIHNSCVYGRVEEKREPSSLCVRQQAFRTLT